MKFRSYYHICLPQATEARIITHPDTTGSNKTRTLCILLGSLVCLPWVGLTSETFHNQASPEQNSNSVIDEMETFHDRPKAEQSDNAIETAGELHISLALGTDPDHDDSATPPSPAPAVVRLGPWFCQ